MYLNAETLEDGLFEDVAEGLLERALESVTRMNPKKMHDSGESEFAFVGISKEDGYVYTLALREETEKGAPATDDIENGPLKGAGRASNISIPQNPEMSTQKSDFSMENVSEEADRSADVAERLRLPFNLVRHRGFRILLCICTQPRKRGNTS